MKMAALRLSDVGAYNPKMTDTQKLPWKRLLAEATAIVLSILLAFAIDAWWEDRMDLPEHVSNPNPRSPLIVDAAFVNNVLDRYKLQQIALRDIGPIIDAVDSILILLQNEISG